MLFVTAISFAQGASQTMFDAKRFVLVALLVVVWTVGAGSSAPIPQAWGEPSAAATDQKHAGDEKQGGPVAEDVQPWEHRDTQP